MPKFTWLFQRLRSKFPDETRGNTPSLGLFLKQLAKHGKVYGVLFVWFALDSQIGVVKVLNENDQFLAKFTGVRNQLPAAEQVVARQHSVSVHINQVKNETGFLPNVSLVREQWPVELVHEFAEIKPLERCPVG